MLAGADLVENMVVKEKTLRDRLAVLNNREQAMVAKLESVQQELDEIVGSLKWTRMAIDGNWRGSEEEFCTYTILVCMYVCEVVN